MNETMQTRVVAILDDMFFASKIKEASRQANVVVDIIKNEDNIIQELTSDLPQLIIIDINSSNIDTLKLISDLKSHSKLKDVKVLGYLPHVEENLKQKAIEAGCDVVMPRSRFSRELRQILETSN